MEEMGSVFSNERIASTFPHYFGSLKLYSKNLYILILVIVSTVFLSLPFIEVNLYVKASGIIRPGTEKTPVHSLVAGIIASVNFTESDRINKGDILITLNKSRKEFELDKLNSMAGQIKSEINDLIILLSGQNGQMQSVKYEMEYMTYSQQSAKLAEKLRKATREKTRHESLFRENLISAKEFDDLLFKEELNRQELHHYIYQKRNQWQNELADLQFRLKQYEGQLKCLAEDLKHCKVASPVSGSIEYLSPVHPGSNIQAGQQLAVVSPDTGIIGEIYIKPSDIARIHLGQNVQLIIDAFDYREWGTVTAEIVEISDDFLVIGNQPVFRIRCKPAHLNLKLKNGYTGTLKKGMTFQALCLVNRKSLWQLLTGKMDNWLNPALGEHKQPVITAYETIR